jgi:hypothetical protein
VKGLALVVKGLALEESKGGFTRVETGLTLSLLASLPHGLDPLGDGCSWLGSPLSLLRSCLRSRVFEGGEVSVNLSDFFLEFFESSLGPKVGVVTDFHDRRRITQAARKRDR